MHLMTKLLRDEYNVFTAENAKEGVAVLENEDIDLIVSNVMMPEMDGMDGFPDPILAILQYPVKHICHTHHGM